MGKDGAGFGYFFSDCFVLFINKQRYFLRGFCFSSVADYLWKAVSNTQVVQPADSQPTTLVHQLCKYQKSEATNKRLLTQTQNQDLLPVRQTNNLITLQMTECPKKVNTVPWVYWSQA